MKYIDSILNRITMYRLVVYSLSLFVVTGVLLASFGRLAMSPVAMIASLAALLIAVFLTEWILAQAWKIPFNSESWLITALIIFLIFPAPKKPSDIVITVAVGALASASKYLFSWNGKHIFNPAAFAVAISGTIGLTTSTWWVGNSAMWPLTLLVGLLIVRKVRRFTLVIVFVATTIVAQLAEFIVHHSLNMTAIDGALFASPLIFLATIMLTEPATMPPRKFQQILFAMGVAVLYVKGEKIGPINLYPEVALLIGNVYAFIVAPKFKMQLMLKEKQKISRQVYNYVFQPDRKFDFLSGQYMEWTLPGVEFDHRGNRRTFTIASSPTETTVQLGVKFYEPSSMYKYELSRMNPGDYISVSQLSGNFTLGENVHKKLVFIAGGIGITPFRSMVKYLIDNNVKADIYLLYVVSDPEELAYREVFYEAEQIGLKYVPIISDLSRQREGMITAKLSAELVNAIVPDYDERVFYVSGPDAMVSASKRTLKQLGVHSTAIKTDHFSGY